MNADPQDDLLRRLHEYYADQYGPSPDPMRVRQRVTHLRQGLVKEEAMMHFIQHPQNDLATSQAAREAQHHRHNQRVLGTGIAVIVVALLGILADLLFAGHIPAYRNVRPIPTATTPPIIQRQITQLSFTSPDDGWAVGEVSTTAAGTDASSIVHSPLLYHYHNGQWSQIDVSATLVDYANTGLLGIAMLSPQDGWIATSASKISGQQYQQLFLHYDGSHWNPVFAAPTPFSFVVGGTLHFVNPACGWLAETDTGRNGAFFFDGKTWQPQRFPAVVSMAQSASAVAPCQIWAAATSINGGQSVGGAGEKDDGLILQNTDGTWRVQQTFKNATVTEISMTSADEGWARGALNQTKDGTVIPTQVLWHYHNGQWVQQPDPTPQGAFLLRMQSASNGWILAVQESNNQDTILFYHYDGQRWQQTQSLNLPPGMSAGVVDMTFVSANEAWVVSAEGPARVYTVANPFLLHYHNGQWSFASFP